MRFNFNVFHKIDFWIIIFYFTLPFIFYFTIFSGNGLWAMGDGASFYVPVKHFFQNSLMNLEFPLWNSEVNLGSPFFSDIQKSVFYVPNLLLYFLLPFNAAYNYMFLFHLTLAGIFMYIYLKQLNLEKKSAFLGGLVFMFCGTLNAKIGHVTVQNSIVWLPLILYFYEKFLLNNRKKNIVFMSLAFSCLIFAGFIQIAVYSAIVLFIYFIFSLKRHGSFKRWFVDLFNFSIISLGIISIQILPMFNLANFVGRTNISYEYFSSYSLPFSSLITIIFPYIFGVHTPNSFFPLYKIFYFGNGNLTEFAMYIGVIPIIFAFNLVIGYFRKEKIVLLWTIIMVSSIVFALGDSLSIINKLMFKIPGINDFRVSARILFVFNISISVLFAKQYDIIIKNKINSKNEKNLLYTSLFISSLVIIVVLTTNKVISILNKNISLDLQSKIQIKNVSFELLKQNFSLQNAAIYLPILLLIFATIYIFIFVKYKNNNYLYYLLIIVLILDLHTFSFYHEKNFVQSDENNDVVKYLVSNVQKNERIWPVIVDETDMNNPISPNNNMNYGLNSINGYVTFLPQKQKSLLSFDERGINPDFANLIINNELLSTLNNEYLIISKRYDSLMNDISNINKDLSNNIFESGEIIISPSVNGQVSMFQKKVHIEPNNIYKITIELNEKIKDPIYIDLYGENYDNPSQEFDLKPENNQMIYTKYIYSENKIPEEVFFRVFSFSEKSSNIKSAKLDIIPKNTKNTLYDKVYNNEQYSIFKNNNVLPKFFSVEKIINSDENKFNENLFQLDLHKTAVVQGFVDDVHNFQKAKVELTEYKNGYAKANTFSLEKSFLVFSESYYPGWKAYVNNKQVNSYKVNELLLGVELPSGNNVVEFKYKPDTLKIGIALFMLTCVYIFFFLFIKRKI